MPLPCEIPPFSIKIWRLKILLLRIFYQQLFLDTFTSMLFSQSVIFIEALRAIQHSQPNCPTPQTINPPPPSYEAGRDGGEPRDPVGRGIAPEAITGHWERIIMIERCFNKQKYAGKRSRGRETAHPLYRNDRGKNRGEMTGLVEKRRIFCGWRRPHRQTGEPDTGRFRKKKYCGENFRGKKMLYFRRK